jgi:hypothetical protein
MMFNKENENNLKQDENKSPSNILQSVFILHQQNDIKQLSLAL